MRIASKTKATDRAGSDFEFALTFGQRVVGIMEGDSVPQLFMPALITHHRAGRFPFDRRVTTFPLARINESPRRRVATISRRPDSMTLLR